MALPNRPIIRRSVAVFAAAGLLVVAAALAVVTVNARPARSAAAQALTIGAMRGTSLRIQMYFLQNKRLPPDLSVLPSLHGFQAYSDSTNDAWNRPLSYEIVANDAYTLTSRGRDGKVGGVEEDRDLMQEYRISNRYNRR
jgi:hypothetical protein